jgi:hypothetical protein
MANVKETLTANLHQAMKTGSKQDKIDAYLKIALHDYNIKEFVNVVSRLNEPFQPCANHFKKCNDEYIGTIFTQVKTLHLIRKITNTKSAKEKNKNNS